MNPLEPSLGSIYFKKMKLLPFAQRYNSLKFDRSGKKRTLAVLVRNMKTKMRRLRKTVAEQLCVCFNHPHQQQHELEEQCHQKQQLQDQQQRQQPQEEQAIEMDLVMQVFGTLKRDLSRSLGKQRGQQLYEEVVRLWDYGFLAAEDDIAMACHIRDALHSTSEDIAVTGPWDLRLGDKRMDFWIRRLLSSEVVVVLVSKALFQDGLLCACLPGLMTSECERCIIPVFVEPISENEIPPALQPLFMIQGVDMEHLGLEESARILASIQEPVLKRYLSKINRLGDLLEKVTANPEKYL